MAAQIRRAEAQDVQRLAELHSAVWAELYTGVLTPAVLASLDPTAMAELWQKFLTRGEAYVQHVAVVDKQVVGFVGVGPGREAGYELGRELYFIVVSPEHRRSGVGKALLAAADADYLWVAEVNRPAQAFYRKQKFFPDSVRRDGALFGTALGEQRMAR